VDNPWKERVLAYNRKRADADDKANDMQTVVDALTALPLLAQIKRLLPDKLLEVLARYGL